MFVVMQKDPGRAFYGKNRPRAPPASRSLCLAPTEAVKRVCPQSPGREEPGWGVHALTHACFPSPFGGLLRGALGETSLLRLNLLSQLSPLPLPAGSRAIRGVQCMFTVVQTSHCPPPGPSDPRAPAPASARQRPLRMPLPQPLTTRICFLSLWSHLFWTLRIRGII